MRSCDGSRLKLLERLFNRRPELLPCRSSIEAAAEILGDAFRRGGKVLVCGNGGSAADADHIVGELMKNFLTGRAVRNDDREAFMNKWGQEGRELAHRLQRALPALSLSAQTSLMTAIANDLGADLVFAQQVYGYGSAGDVLIGISTSGNSLNVIRAAQVAHVVGLKTIGLTGQDGGRLAGMCDVSIRVPFDEVAEVQEAHEAIYHTLCAIAEADAFGAV